MAANVSSTNTRAPAACTLSVHQDIASEATSDQTCKIALKARTATENAQKTQIFGCTWPQLRPY